MLPNTDTQLADLLRSRGYRVTPQRIAIHQLLREQDRHLTADQVRAAVADRLPGTSGPTIYATLDLLAELGLVRRIDAGTGATLYDSRAEPHHHAVCRRCGRVEDLEARTVDAAGVMRAAEGSGFEAQQVDVVVSGLCARCGAATARRA
jgi:Fe2+ or Zn2+ uptake regulation protein